jgi:uncharacterized protein
LGIGSFISAKRNVVFDSLLKQHKIKEIHIGEVKYPFYYVLPVLYGDRLVARFEPGKHLDDAPFAIKNWWWEPGITVTVEMRDALQVCLKSFAKYLGANGIEWLNVN